MSKTANSNEARAPLTAGQTARNAATGSTLAGFVGKLMLDAGMDPTYAVFLAPYLQGLLNIAGNILRNVAEHSRFARWLG